MRYCSECGSENPNQAKFCRNCGAVLKQSDGEDLSAASDIGEIRQDKMNFNDLKENKIDSAVTASKNKDSIISKLLYKTDKRSGELRLSKTKAISIGMFIFMFSFGMYSGSATESFFVVFIAAILFGLFFAIPTFAIGYAIGWVLEKNGY